MTHPGSFTTFAATGSPSGPPIDTGTWFVVGAAGTGPTGGVAKLESLDDYVDRDGVRAAATAAIYDSLELFFRSGGAVAYLTTAAAGAGFAAASATALGLFPKSLGAGQVSIPGATDAATHAAVAAHATATERTAILDAPDVAAPALLTAAAATRTAVVNDERYGLFAGWPILDALPGGAVRTAPPCGGVAGRINAVDGRVQHAGAAAAGDQGWGAGLLAAAIGVSRTYTDSEWDDLTAAGVNLLVPNANGRVEVYGWRTGSTDPLWTYLNYQRLRMQIVAGGKAIGRPFVFRLIDGPRLFSELRHALDGYLLGLYERGAFYGATPEIAFQVDTVGPNTPAVTAAGELKANVTYIPAGLAERVTTQISMSSQEAAA